MGTQPNFVFIMTDTQGANVIGCYNTPDLHTPHIDRLAAEGIRYDRAYTTVPVCSPARAGLFTGVYAHNSGPWSNNMPLGANVKTMGQRFRDGGYQTAYVGKWHLDGLDYFGDGVCADGWDDRYWYDGKRYLDDLSDEDVTLWRSGLKSIEDLKAHNITAEFTWAHRISDRAIDFLQQTDSDPFLLVVSYDEPHGPCTCPPEYAERFADFKFPLGPASYDTLADKPAHQQQWAEVLNLPARDVHANPLYYGCNSFVDTEIGRVIDAVPENTYVIFTSDHGDMHGAHRLTSKGPVAYDEITRIPLIIRQPYSHRAGTVETMPVSHIDLLPTMLELAGLDVVPILDGESLRENLQYGTRNEDRCVMVEFQRHSLPHDSYGGLQLIRSLVTERYKLVVNLFYTDELYDHQIDAAEVNNLIDDPDYDGVRNRMLDTLLERMNQLRDPFRGPVWEQRPWRKERKLEWDGYYRARPDDGYAPPALLYGTGRPASEQSELKKTR